MATSDEIENCTLQRGRSQSDPNILTESCIDLAHSTGNGTMDQQRALHSGCLVAGLHTPPIGRNSKLASLGRIFKPWKWRKNKNEKLRPGPTALERRTTARQNRGVVPASGRGLEELGSPSLSTSDVEEVEGGVAPPDVGSEEEEPPTVLDSAVGGENMGEDHPNVIEEGEAPLMPPVGDEHEGDNVNQEGREDGKGDTRQGPSTPPQSVHSGKVLSRLGSLEESSRVSPLSKKRNSFHSKEVPLAPEGPRAHARGKVSTPTRSPHLGNLRPPLPPSCIIEELHRALATKHRQDSFHGREVRASPKRRSEGRLPSTEKDGGGMMESRKDSEENKENLRQDGGHTLPSSLPLDQDRWNDSVTSGTLPRRIKKELLAVKLRNRPSKQELEDRNIFPVRSDLERQEIRQQIETKLANEQEDADNADLAEAVWACSH